MLSVRMGLHAGFVVAFQWPRPHFCCYQTPYSDSPRHNSCCSLYRMSFSLSIFWVGVGRMNGGDPHT
jgi:hypothetical protein